MFPGDCAILRLVLYGGVLLGAFGKVIDESTGQPSRRDKVTTVSGLRGRSRKLGSPGQIPSGYLWRLGDASHSVIFRRTCEEADTFDTRSLGGSGLIKGIDGRCFDGMYIYGLEGVHVCWSGCFDYLATLVTLASRCLCSAALTEGTNHTRDLIAYRGILIRSITVSEYDLINSTPACK